jgi:hypothetical protein
MAFAVCRVRDGMHPAPAREAEPAGNGGKAEGGAIEIHEPERVGEENGRSRTKHLRNLEDAVERDTALIGVVFNLYWDRLR